VSADKPSNYDYYEKCSKTLLKVSHYPIQNCKNEEFMLKQDEPTLLEGIPSLELIVYQKDKTSVMRSEY
jgi:hypothetical protein